MGSSWKFMTRHMGIKQCSSKELDYYCCTEAMHSTTIIFSDVLFLLSRVWVTKMRVLDW
jgi:hypothetical protein